MGLHGRDSYVVVLIPETVACSVGSANLDEAQGVQSPPQGAHYHEDSFFAPVVGNLNGSKGTNGTPS